MNSKRIVIELGHSEKEWQERFGNNQEESFWDFPIEEFDGTENISIKEDTVYWSIGNRLYETNISNKKEE